MKEQKIKDNSKHYFDRIARNNRVIKEPTLCYEAVMDFLKNNPGFHSLADISCGTGVMLSKVQDTFGNQRELYGVDLSPVSLDVAREKTSGKAVLLEGDVDNLPLENGRFDIVLNMHSFHHYPKPLRALGEIERILSQDGTFILVENDLSTKRRLRGNLIHFLIRHKMGDVQMYSEKRLHRFLKSAGFKVISSEPVGEKSRMWVCQKA